MKDQRAKREEEIKAAEAKAASLARLAGAKHDAHSYYAQRDASDATLAKHANDIDGPSRAAGGNPGRLASLARPKDRDKHKLLQELDQRAPADPYEQGEKEIKLSQKLRQKRTVDFADYIDRDVPHIAQGGVFARKKTTKGLKDF